MAILFKLTQIRFIKFNYAKNIVLGDIFSPITRKKSDEIFKIKYIKIIVLY